MDDEILREIREYRDAYAARFNYDLDAMCRDLRERTRASGRRVVSFAGPASDRSAGGEARSARPDDAGAISGANGPADGRR